MVLGKLKPKSHHIFKQLTIVIAIVIVIWTNHFVYLCCGWFFFFTNIKVNCSIDLNQAQKKITAFPMPWRWNVRVCVCWMCMCVRFENMFAFEMLGNLAHFSSKRGIYTHRQTLGRKCVTSRSLYHIDDIQLRPSRFRQSFLALISSKFLIVRSENVWCVFCGYVVGNMCAQIACSVARFIAHSIWKVQIANEPLVFPFFHTCCSFSLYKQIYAHCSHRPIYIQHTKCNRRWFGSLFC